MDKGIGFLEVGKVVHSCAVTQFHPSDYDYKTCISDFVNQSKIQSQNLRSDGSNLYL